MIWHGGWRGLPHSTDWTQNQIPSTWGEGWALTRSRQTHRQTAEAGRAVQHWFISELPLWGRGPLFSLRLWFPGHGLTTHMGLILFCVSMQGAPERLKVRQTHLLSHGVSLAIDPCLMALDNPLRHLCQAPSTLSPRRAGSRHLPAGYPALTWDTVEFQQCGRPPPLDCRSRNVASPTARPCQLSSPRDSPEPSMLGGACRKPKGWLPGKG